MSKVNFIQLRDFFGNPCLIAIDDIRVFVFSKANRGDRYVVYFKSENDRPPLALHKDITLEDILEELNACE